MFSVRRTIRFVVLILALVAGVFIGRPAIFLLDVWWHDGSLPMADERPGTNDASHLNPHVPSQVIVVEKDPAKAETQLSTLVRETAKTGGHLSISGAHHSMGGHTLYPGGIVLDMLSFNRMWLNEASRILTVGSGARWRDIIPFLDRRGLAVAVMQSNNDFSVGGSISVNCHGWQNDSPPIASTVESFRLMLADGTIRRCSRTENPELFRLTLGGYGLFGIILDVDLRVVSNEYYQAEAHVVSPKDYNRIYHELTHEHSDIGMAYGRIDVAPDSFFQHTIITILRRVKTDRSVADTLTVEKPNALKRFVFRGGADSDYGKNLRWTLETLFGETGGVTLSRNQIMNESSYLFANRDPVATDILHEYFIPSAQLGEFILKSREVLLGHHADLLNVTIRNVEPDADTFMHYTRGEVFGLVFLFNQHRTPEAEAAMKALTQELVETALNCNGTYYLPYRLHATVAQFHRAYPQAEEFFKRKRSYDPNDLFENEFSKNYGPQGVTP